MRTFRCAIKSILNIVYNCCVLQIHGIFVKSTIFCIFFIKLILSRNNAYKTIQKSCVKISFIDNIQKLYIFFLFILYYLNYISNFINLSELFYFIIIFKKLAKWHMHYVTTLFQNFKSRAKIILSEFDVAHCCRINHESLQSEPN